VGQVRITDGETLQVLMLLGLEELKNFQIDPREGICMKVCDGEALEGKMVVSCHGGW